MHWGYVIAGYAIIFSGLGAYVAAVLFRGRELSKRVPQDRRRFLE